MLFLIWREMMNDELLRMQAEIIRREAEVLQMQAEFLRRQAEAIAFMDQFLKQQTPDKDQPHD
jgi:hypothetical protein